MSVTSPLPPLIDQHCHGVVRTQLGIGSFEPYLTEAHAPAAPGTTYFDTQTGFAVRRWCPPLLGLEPHCPPAHYLARRRELGPYEATRRLLAGTGIGTFLVDTGLPGDLTAPDELAGIAGGAAHEIVRLESVAEQVADASATAAAFVSDLAEAVHAAAETAIAFKSVAAYRHGLALAPQPPSPAYVRLAAEDWLAARAPGGRVTDPVLLRHLLWNAVATGLPLQLHTGFGDPDLRLDRADPTLLTDFVRATADSGAAIVLLHGYPYHRQAAYLAHVFPHVYADVGLALTHTGSRAAAVLAETLELAPFGKLMFSTDAYGLPELFVTGARLFTDALERLFTAWVDEGAWSRPDADRVAALLVDGNARRVYRLP
ncbi:amidohydrolase family protein [Streptomyces sp. SL13]|jgi:predicted TIM-barrel fold metal-dependent hydrolase|uniref:Amidohydrolase family protein n=1 Tax=Streptantibioticus silvisoli TaxID=2705255 RepID=A0AA90HE19_9ACTN|nr:amidohydrolase family protein [Streptantibioticus silvisoli]MDI5963133.1 amidohydrolase family protein [Streptantibioticus silvisoli]MDI5973177.1 amidohydrolase family protein [Streptantibioticus silvisoli]